MRALSVTAAFQFQLLGVTTLQARIACPSRVYALRRYISRAIFFMYPYVFVAGPNKHDNLLDYLCQRNSKFDNFNISNHRLDMEKYM
jgi:hypothetical protein